MSVQDLAIVLWSVLLVGSVIWGVTGPRHFSTHVLLLVTSLFTPFIAFDLSQAAKLPTEAWAIAAAFVGMQIVHTVFHALRPAAPHSAGPEILFQPIICIWAATFAQRLDPALWYNGTLGRFAFSTELVFVSLAVMVYIYMSQMTSRHDDEIDFAHYTLRSRSNASFLAASNLALLVTMYAATSEPLWLAGAVVVFVGTRILVPLGPEAQRKG